MVSRTTLVGLLCVVCLSVPAVAWPGKTDRWNGISGFAAGTFEHANIPAPNGWEQLISCGNPLPYAIGILTGLTFALPVYYWMHHRYRRRLLEQRALMGDELHDQLGPMVYYCRMLLASEIRQQSAPNDSIQELQSQLAQVGETLRDLSRTLRNEGSTTVQALEAVLGMQLERWHELGSGAYIVHGIVPGITLSLVQYTQLLRVLQEFMLNSCRHAPGKSIHLAFETSRRRLRIRYWDEGKGVDPALSAGTGTCSTVARMQRIGGTLEMDNRFPNGYEIVLTLPL